MRTLGTNKLIKSCVDEDARKSSNASLNKKNYRVMVCHKFMFKDAVPISIIIVQVTDVSMRRIPKPMRLCILGL